jgi:hypothetical protein
MEEKHEGDTHARVDLNTVSIDFGPSSSAHPRKRLFSALRPALRFVVFS